MKFAKLLDIVGGNTVFSSRLLFSGRSDVAALRRQINRWTRRGQLRKLRRGVYQLMPPYAREMGHPFVVANQLCEASFVSLQSALAFYGLIPEEVFATTSVTTGRPETIENESGRYIFRHAKTSLFFGFTECEIAPGVSARIALAEKALVDLFYFTKGADNPNYLKEMRIETSRIDWDKAMAFARTLGSHKVSRTLACLRDMAGIQENEEVVL